MLLQTEKSPLLVGNSISTLPSAPLLSSQNEPFDPNHTKYNAITTSGSSITPHPENKDNNETPKSTRGVLWALVYGNFWIAACVSLQAPFFPKEAEMKGKSESFS